MIAYCVTAMPLFSKRQQRTNGASCLTFWLKTKVVSCFPVTAGAPPRIKAPTGSPRKNRKNHVSSPTSRVISGTYVLTSDDCSWPLSANFGGCPLTKAPGPNFCPGFCRGPCSSLLLLRVLIAQPLVSPAFHKALFTSLARPI